MTDKIILPGEKSGDYSLNWRKTFDFVFLSGWIGAFIILTIATIILQPELFNQYFFFLYCFIKVLVISIMSFCSGLLCRHYCKVDEKGYIKTNKDSWFKVNYTRKVQHFAAYLVPLINLGDAGSEFHPVGVLHTIWESLLVLFVFLLLIKPIREHSRFFMIQFNSLDRPEDRPNTLKWIVSGNILPGLILVIIFKQLFEQINEEALVLIIVCIIGIGDGLAEPVGIYFGKKTYLAPSWFLKKRYVRSYAGSACVFICSLIIIALFYTHFNSTNQFILAMIIIPPVITFVEATAPHSMDTPIMMICGFVSLYLIAM